MRNRRRLIFLISLLVVASAVVAVLAWPARRATGSIVQDVYVWQRVWTPPVREAVAAHRSSFDTVVVLGAQVNWSGQTPKTALPTVDWAALKTARSVGVALRINAFQGDFSRSGQAAEFLANLSEKLIGEARSGGVLVSELQLDFDCPESKLEGYAQWVSAIQQKISPVPVVITALPSWLDARGFELLAKTAGKYVLQVHSVDRPTLGGVTLCDASAAQAAVEKAGRIGVPFRVALPTYGYLAAFDEGSKFIGLSAEGRSPNWPADATVRAIRANANELAALVAQWTNNRPATMTGIIWYRLPTEADTLNWRWKTLETVMAGRQPVSALTVTQSTDAQGVVTLLLCNTGECDEPMDFVIQAKSPGMVSADGYNGFVAQTSAEGVKLSCSDRQFRLGAGDQRVVGWIRPGNTKEVLVRVVR